MLPSEPMSLPAAIDARSQKPAEPSIGEFLRKNAIGLAAALGAFVLLFWSGLSKLVESWNDERYDFSHGYLIPVISAGILWTHRKKLAALPARSSNLGLALLVGSVLVLVAGNLSVTETLQRFAVLGGLLGAVWFLLGTPLLRAKPFPFLFLALAIPPPAGLLAPLRLKLKGMATVVTADVLQFIGIPADAQGNILHVGDMELEVADACSGIRSLMAIVTTAVLFAYLFRTGPWKGALLILTAIPVTLLANILRIATVAVGLARYDVDLARGTPHEMLGFAVYGLSLGLLYLSWRFYDWFFRWKPSASRQPGGGIASSGHAPSSGAV